MSKFKKVLIAGAAAAGILLAGTAAYAVVTNRSGTFSDQQHFVHNTDAFATGLSMYVNVPGATTSITLPPNTLHLFDARFTAESQCVGSAAGWCSVRIVVVIPTGAVIELDPASSLDYAFDSAGATDAWEGHALERTSQVYPGGVYRFVVQARPVAGATGFRLDDWTLAVEAVRAS